MGERLRRLAAYGRLARLPSLGHVATLPIFGFLASGGAEAWRARSAPSLVILFIVGGLSYIAGIALNEYVDVDLDRAAKLSGKPLVSGELEPRQALRLGVVTSLLAIAILVAHFQSLAATWVLASSLLLVILYDVSGKRYAGTDLFLASSVATLFASGALTASTALTPLALVIAGALFFRILFQNSVEMSLKDVPYDRRGGRRTPAIVLGVSEGPGGLHLSGAFKAYAAGVELAYVLLVSLPFLLPATRYWRIEYDGWHYIAQAVLIVGLFVTLRSLLTARRDRTQIKRASGLHELLTYPIVPLMLVPFTGVAGAVILGVFPAVWFLVFSLLLYRRMPGFRLPAAAE